MKREELLGRIEKWDGFRAFSGALSEGGGKAEPGGQGRPWPLRLFGAERSAAAYVAYASVSRGAPGKKIVYLTPNDYAARRAYEDFDFLSGHRCVLLEHSEYMFYDALARSEEIEYRRMETLKKILDGDFDVLVLSAEAFIQFMLPPERLAKSTLRFSAGDTAEPLSVADALAAAGYIRVGQIDGKRQFAVRGDILDVFPTSSENPYRLEFYGDEIDSVRVFDLLSQRTVETAPFVEILADSEQSAGYKGGELCERVRAALAEKLQAEESPAARKQTEEKVEADLARLLTEADFPGRDRYVPFIIGREYHILDYTADAVVFVQEWRSVLAAAETVIEEHGKTCELLDETSCVLTPLWNLYMTPAEMEQILRQHTVVMTEPDCGPDQEAAVRAAKKNEKTANLFAFETRPVGDAGGRLEIVDELFARWKEEGLLVCILTGNRARAERIHELMRDRAPSVPYDVTEGALSRGFESRSIGCAIVSDTGLAGKSVRVKAKKARKERNLDTFADIAPGDLVVHDLHGIGRFEGFKSLELEGVMKDYLVIRYAEDGILYLPSYQMDTLHKFIGSDGVTPKLNTLGGKEWQRARQRVKDSLREYVEELVALYARRQRLKGFAYSADTVWQREFENSFPFEATEDQEKCTEEIKRDMERPVPMERLLCGDVGFGKTEVALRAAFKAVCDDKQVAFLVPTTVLAQQHYQNISKRFEEYPVTVDYLCRFRTPAERSRILARLQKGEIDILIGTHSILQKKAVFRDLGLIIIDEEQRFGVMQKENLKMKWPGTDILALSATPIPRTLHMSLSGIRDISLLTEPPKSRSPVQTYVLEMNPEVVKNAIYREMARNGQVFYLYNAVQRMTEKRMQLQKLVPEARIGVAHGQMPERELENVMNAFVKGEYDILLCSTIIESGLDMPNVNTIIVEDGHRLGLAQLYQIRGRVGRSERRAYAYITYPPDSRLNEDAEKRLNTIREFTEFGSGFKVALRDLEIRGAGSVLGEKQHGQMAAVGYDMYCRLLGEMVAEAQGAQPEEETVINVEFHVSSFIPESYIADPNARLDVYRKIARVQDEDDISDLTDELIDRFGDVPDNVRNLMQVSRIRCLAAECGVTSVIQHGAVLELPVSSPAAFEQRCRERGAELIKRFGTRFVFNPGDRRKTARLQLPREKDADDPACILSELVALFLILRAEPEKPGPESGKPEPGKPESESGKPEPGKPKPGPGNPERK